MQQDTFWRRNLFELNLEDNMDNINDNDDIGQQQQHYDLLFDQVGHGKHSQRAGWVNGANFFIRANNQTHAFFEAVADKLAHWYAPDMGIMIHQCNTWETPKCAFIPHKIANSWEWMYTDQRNAPHVIQLDCETDGKTKLQQLARFGFYFTKRDGRTCDPEAVQRTQQIMDKGQVDVGGPVRLSWGRFQFKVYWWLVDYILCTPLIGPYLKTYLPLAGYILTVTIA
uniref:Nucleotide-diphospho-sugar transferase domain-containing protein n=1 Tax=Globodera rostochiensis TaxID=31243 RepID=A0A914HCQ5_GLORO